MCCTKAEDRFIVFFHFSPVSVATGFNKHPVDGSINEYLNCWTQSQEFLFYLVLQKKMFYIHFLLSTRQFCNSALVMVSLFLSNTADQLTFMNLDLAPADLNLGICALQNNDFPLPSSACENRYVSQTPELKVESDLQLVT